MSNEKWSEWEPADGERCPLKDGVMAELKFEDGDTAKTELSEGWEWKHDGAINNIIAYRYRIDENEIPPDLEWLARTVHEWQGTRYVTMRKGAIVWTDKSFPGAVSFMHEQWLQARKDLGLIMTDAEAELPAEDWAATITDTPEEAAMVEDMVNGGFKQLRYQDANGEDWIDEFARTSTLDEFRGAMRFTIGKYNRRAGKKDELISEIEKMRDYCGRWLAYEKERL